MSNSVIKPHRSKSTTMNSTKANTVLPAGEMFIEYPSTGLGTGHSKIKVGDGVTKYSSLPYAVGDRANDTITYSNNAGTSATAALSSAASGNALGTIIAALKQAETLTDATATSATTASTNNASSISTLQTSVSTNTDNISSLTTRVNGLANISMQVIPSTSALPDTGSTSVFYFLETTNPSTGTSTDKYDMYIWNADGYYSKIGSSSVDLSGYAKTTDVTTSINAATATLQTSINTNSTAITNITNGTTKVGKATNADTATYATNAGTATYATNASTATYVLNASTAQYAVSAKNASSATYATSAGSAT